ncbi:SDR family NAD(P)-dependent oxidoreductase [Paenarthrobacter sp. NPDC089989]|uniref:SDR family NAD(P)-dependent oxidoreductase n=1 Tax=unclassified Paenarthrobacter TaxID=2634190 RepID=UPI00380D2624
MAKILITGSSDGLGRGAAEALLDGGHSVVVHVRTEARLVAVDDLLGRGAEAVVGDLAHTDQVRDLVRQANELGRFDAVIHNAGVLDGSSVLPVNVVAPYLLTAGMDRPDRVVYLSSGMHRGGHPDLQGIKWSGARASRSYSDSKLFVTTLMAAVARLWPGVSTHAVDPGWVPTRMGGAGAPDDLRLGHLTQVWLAAGSAPEAQGTGQYWYHQMVREPHPSVHDHRFQDALLSSLSEHTGVSIQP